MRISFTPMAAEQIQIPGTRLPAYVLIPALAGLIYLPLMPYVVVYAAITWYIRFKGRNYFWVYRRFKGILHAGRVASRPIWHIRRFSGVFTLEDY